MSNDGIEDITGLRLAAEDWEPEEFARYHRFSRNDERVILKLIGHGPVLLQGGRGSGKSALMIAAAQRVAPYVPESPIFGVYISLRQMSLLRSVGLGYVKILCDLIIDRVHTALKGERNFSAPPEVSALQQRLGQLSTELGKRIVLFFDDAAHIGREVSLGDFFDTFRTLASSNVSCKAPIYPGVTQFGNRFDVYNDATVVDVIRDEEQPGFTQVFAEIVQLRYPTLAAAEFTKPLSLEGMARLLGQSVVGNMRGFVIACNYVEELHDNQPIGVKLLGQTLLHLAQNHYWPLFDEVRPKLGKYAPMTEPAEQVMRAMLQKSATEDGAHRSALVHRDLISRMPKVFEILEYVGFISRREASRAMKSGGRGSRFVLNLCNLLEVLPGNRLTTTLFERWTNERDEPVELHTRGSQLSEIVVPGPLEDAELPILKTEISRLKKSAAYPYGLTDQKIKVLESSGYSTVGSVADASDEELDALYSIGPAQIRRIRNVVAQAIWM